MAGEVQVQYTKELCKTEYSVYDELVKLKFEGPNKKVEWTKK